MRRLTLVALVSAIVVELGRSAVAEGLTAKEASTARKLYEVKCAKCHKFYEPTEYGQAEWNRWMEKMAKKSRLNGDQTRLLTEFLNEYRKRGGSPPK